MIKSTQCYLESGENWLMLYRNKKQNDPNAGKWIAAGGKLEPGETVDECAVREVIEETGFKMNSFTKRAVVQFISDTFDDEEMHIYTSDDFQKICEPVSDEGQFEWIPVSEIFNLNLWEGDRLFLKYLIEARPYFEMRLEYRGDHLVYASLDGQSINI